MRKAEVTYAHRTGTPVLHNGETVKIVGTMMVEKYRANTLLVRIEDADGNVTEVPARTLRPTDGGR